MKIQKKGMPIASLFFSILGCIITCGVLATVIFTNLIGLIVVETVLISLTTLLGVIFGHIGRANLRKSPETYGGDGMAIAGLIIGYISIIILMVLLFFKILDKREKELV